MTWPSSTTNCTYLRVIDLNTEVRLYLIKHALVSRHIVSLGQIENENFNV